jgi:hypothetical protein
MPEIASHNSRRCPGKFPEALYDGHNIFMCYACDHCKAEKLAGFRPDIFDNYECDEPIEDD